MPTSEEGAHVGIALRLALVLEDARLVRVRLRVRVRVRARVRVGV
tara:strand:- start:130 stop:264 length:135 start_codon:yes stop_codon:yes gene_type:complete